MRKRRHAGRVTAAAGRHACTALALNQIDERTKKGKGTSKKAKSEPGTVGEEAWCRYRDQEGALQLHRAGGSPVLDAHAPTLARARRQQHHSCYALSAALHLLLPSLD